MATEAYFNGMILHPTYSSISISVPFNNGTTSVLLQGYLVIPEATMLHPLVIITNGPATTAEVPQKNHSPLTSIPGS